MTNVKKLLNLTRLEWPLLGRGLVFLIISSGALLAYPQFIRKIIDEALQTGNREQLNLAAFLAVGVFLLQSLTSALRYYYFTVAGEKAVQRLRTRLYEQIIGQKIEFFDQQKSGELIGRLNSDTQVLQNALSVNISMLVRGMAQAIGGVVMLFLTSAQLTVFILLIIPPIGILAARFGKKVKAISRRAQDALADSSGVAEEGIAGVRTVKAFGQEAHELGRYKRQLAGSFSITKEKIKLVASFTNLVSMTGLTAVVFIVWYGGTLVIEGRMSVGTLTSFLLYVLTVGFSVGMLGSLWTDFVSAIGASGRIFELLEKPVEDLETGHGSIDRGLIRFEDVTFSYPMRKDATVFSGLTLTINQQETCAVVGASGAGKSTLVQLLLRSYDADSGIITIDDKNINEYALKILRGSIGIVSQEPVLISESILENIRYGRPLASEEEVFAAARKAYAHEFITRFPQGYQTLVGERGIQLSGGQKQRVAIARALLKDPTILILDEATSALDAESEHLVQKALEEQLGERTTIVIAHRLSTVKRADKIIVMREGQVVQTGTHQELLKEGGYYRQLIEKQFDSDNTLST